MKNVYDSHSCVRLVDGPDPVGCVGADLGEAKVSTLVRPDGEDQWFIGPNSNVLALPKRGSAKLSSAA